MSPLSNLAPAADAARDEMTAALAGFDERRAQLLEALERVAVTDEDATGRAGDFLSQLKTLRDRVNGRRAEIRAPYDEAVKAADATAEKWLAGILAAIETVEGKIRDFRDEQRELAAAAQARQAEEEAAARLERVGEAGPATAPAAAEPIVLPRTRGDFGSTVSDRKKTVFKIVNVRRIPDLILGSDRVQKAIIAQCAVAHKLMAEIPGVEISTGLDIRHRK